MNKFKAGMVVYLKSGGPPMVCVNAPNCAGDHVHCQWLDEGKVQDGDFPWESLVLLDGERLLGLFRPRATCLRQHAE